MYCYVMQNMKNEYDIQFSAAAATANSSHVKRNSGAFIGYKSLPI
jgi:hypothetical protein